MIIKVGKTINPSSFQYYLHFPIMSIFRQYTYDDSFQQVFVSSKLLREYQIALIFARDYDENDKPTNGIFHIYWDKTKVTPLAIAQFKKENPHVTVKVFISIGDRDSRFPFQPLDNEQWISNATHSLTDIIQDEDYDINVNGIDIFYEHIHAEPDDFALCVGKLIKNLKEARVISVASISPSAAVNKDYYFCLFHRFGNLIEWVDYQFQNEETRVPTPDVLTDRYNVLVTEFYPRKKLFAGYSAENEDWAKLSPIVFFLVGSDLFKKRRAAGFSILYHNFVDKES